LKKLIFSAKIKKCQNILPAEPYVKYAKILRQVDAKDAEKQKVDLGF
jgi:hypothetical protein